MKRDLNPAPLLRKEMQLGGLGDQSVLPPSPPTLWDQEAKEPGVLGRGLCRPCPHKGGQLKLWETRPSVTISNAAPSGEVLWETPSEKRGGGLPLAPRDPRGSPQNPSQGAGFVTVL